MIESTFNMFDAGVLLVVGLSALLSFFRGFVREIFSLGSWLGATVITLYAFQPASKYLAPHVGSAVVASGLASMGVFFTSLILISILTGLILKFVKSGNEVGVLDNLMGLVFGVARGLLVVAIAYFTATIVPGEKNLPDYVFEAKSQPFVAKCAKWVGKVTPKYLDDIAKKDLHSDAPEDLEKDAKRLGDTFKRASKVKRIEDEDLPEGTLPSMEDLQERIRQENKGR